MPPFGPDSRWGGTTGDLLTIAQALACPVRLYLLQVLGPEGKHLSAAAADAGVSASTAHHHLDRLMKVGLAKKSYRGRRCIYRWSDTRWSLVATRAPGSPGSR